LLLLGDFSASVGSGADPLAQSFLDSIKASPAYICTRRLDVVAYNRIADALFDFAGDGSTLAHNQLLRIYTDPQRRKRHKSPATEKAFLLSTLKASRTSSDDTGTARRSIPICTVRRVNSTTPPLP
jgi:hypothetical protein